MRPIRAEPHGQARPQHLRDRRGPFGQFHVRLRAMGRAHATTGQGLDVILGGPGQVSAQNVLVQHAELLQIGHRREVVLVSHLLQLGLRFRHVDHQGDIVSPREGRCLFKMVGRDRVRRMGRDGRRDQTRLLPLAHVVLAIGHRRGPSLVIRRGKVQNGLTEYPAHSGLGRLLRDRVFEVVHVDVRLSCRPESSQGSPAACPSARTLRRRSWLPRGRCSSAANP